MNNDIAYKIAETGTDAKVQWLLKEYAPAVPILKIVANRKDLNSKSRNTAKALILAYKEEQEAIKTFWESVL